MDDVEIIFTLHEMEALRGLITDEIVAKEESE